MGSITIVGLGELVEFLTPSGTPLYASGIRVRADVVLCTQGVKADKADKALGKRHLTVKDRDQSLS